MHKKILLSILATLAAGSSWAQASEPANTRIQWGVSGGINQYKEPDFMQLKGPEVGLHARVTRWANMPNTQLEGDILLGKQKYSSEKSGSMSGVTNLETRWRALWPMLKDTPREEGFSAGVALHTLWNDLRGNTTFQGTTYGGYQRSAAQLWLPVRWSSGEVWELDAGLLLYGRHLSKLSDVGPGYSDVTNTQRHGQYAQVLMNIALNNDDTLKPYIRYTHLGDSNTVPNREPNGVIQRLEPESQRWQIGAVWEFAAP